jgi:hypothetical protein
VRLAAADRHQRPVAIIFHLVEPAIAGRNDIDQRGKLDGPKGGGFDAAALG